MDQLKMLSDFFSAIRDDGRISITHIGIYAALLQYRIDCDFANPIQVFGHEIMRIAKISAPITYHKCIKELSAYGYIHYIPSFKRNQASRIYFPVD
ncbi:MAG: hypothetical protein JST70_16735 [Bacteroidetes bacterium]|nr:hypothetical protein [Bacteroidota bacterium]